MKRTVMPPTVPGVLSSITTSSHLARTSTLLEVASGSLSLVKTVLGESRLKLEVLCQSVIDVSPMNIPSSSSSVSGSSLDPTCPLLSLPLPRQSTPHPSVLPQPSSLRHHALPSLTISMVFELCKFSCVIASSRFCFVVYVEIHFLTFLYS